MPTPSTAEKESTPLDSALAGTKLGRPSSDMLCITTPCTHPLVAGLTSSGSKSNQKAKPRRKHNTLIIMLGQTGTQCHPVTFGSTKQTCHTKAKTVLMQPNIHAWIPQAQNTALIQYVLTGSVHSPSRLCEQPGSPLSSCN